MTALSRKRSLAERQIGDVGTPASRRCERSLPALLPRRRSPLLMEPTLGPRRLNNGEGLVAHSIHLISHQASGSVLISRDSQSHSTFIGRKGVPDPRLHIRKAGAPQRGQMSIWLSIE